MTDAVRVRNGDVQDLHAIVDIASASPTAPRWQRSDYRALLDPPDPDAATRRCLLVAEAEGVVQGYAVLLLLTVVYPAEAELESLAVSPTYRRRGAGHALMQAVEQTARRHRCRCILLEVRQSNAAAIHLYQSAGFEPLGVRRAYYTSPIEDALQMHLTLL